MTLEETRLELLVREVWGRQLLPLGRGKLTRDAERDRAVWLFDRHVLVWERDPSRMARLVLRSNQEGLAHYGVRMHGWPDQFPHWAWMDRIHGRDVTVAEFPDLYAHLLHMHAEGGKQVRGDLVNDVFYRSRVWKRCHDRHPRWESLVTSWRLWDHALRTENWVRWHGDPTFHNALVDRNGGVWLVDHSPEFMGPAEYDMAKARRCLLVTNDLEVVGDPKDFRGDWHLAVVLAGMLANHGDELLAELFREVTGE